MSRKLLNCWIVAAYLWISALKGKGRRYIWFRPSTSFHGVILHAGVAQGVRGRSLVVVEFIPIKAEFGTWKNFLILFRGQFRVWKFSTKKVCRFDTIEDALKFADFPKRD